MNQHHGRTLRADPKPCSRAVRNAMFVLIGVTAMAIFPAQETYAQSNQSAVAKSNYSIPAGPLGPALSQFAASAGISIAAETSIVSGQVTQGIQGNFTAYEGLSRLLEKTELEVVDQGNGNYSLRHQKNAGPTTSLNDTVLPTVMVTSQDRATTEGSGSFAARSATIGKGEQSLKDIPQSVSVITRERMETQGLKTLNEALAMSTGVTITMSDPDRMTYNVRGYSVDALQFDGMAFSPSPSTGGMLIQTDMALLDRIEILRGSAGLLQGTGNPSAAVNMVRKRPLAEFGGSVAATVGRWDRYRVEADVSSPLNEAGTVRGRVVAAYDDRKFFQDARMENRQTLYGVVEADITNRTRLTSGITYQDLDTTGSWYGLPSTPTGGIPTYFPRSTYLGGAWNRWSRTNTSAFLEIEHQFDNEWKIKANATHMVMNLYDFRQSTHSGTYNPATGLGLNINPGTNCSYGDTQNSFEVLASGPFSLLGRRHELLVGASARDGRIFNPCAPMTGITYNNVDPFTWNPYDMVTPTPGAYSTYNRIDTNQQGAYATARLNISDPLKLILGARVSSYEFINAGFTSAGARTSRVGYEVERQISPYAGIVYELSPQYNLYASYTDVFAPQNSIDRNGNVLDPITGASYEAGIKGEFFDRKLNASFAVFRIDQKNRAISDVNGPSPCPYSTGGTPATYCSVAQGQTRSQGFEVEVSGELAPGLQVFSGYTFNKTKYIFDLTNAGNVLSSQTPRHIFRAAADYRLLGELNAWSIGGSVQVQSDTFNRSGTRIAEQGGYTLTNLQAAYRITPSTTLSLHVNNLFDKVYFQQISTGSSNFYGEPRNVTLTLRNRF